MTIPDEVMEAASALLDGEYIAQSDVYEILDEGQILATWINNQPVAPEPDWSDAPTDKPFDWLPVNEPQWCTIDADGLRKWHYTEPAVIRNEWRSPYYRYDNPGFCRYVELPIGIDWRTTLRRRPEAGK